MKKIKIALVLFAGMICSLPCAAQDLKTKASVDFKIRNLGINVDGYFSNVTITTNFNAEDLSLWMLSGSVKVNSITTGNEKRDAHLLKEDYFDVNTYPEIRIEATNFSKVSKNKYDVTLNLTIKKTTKTITIPIKIVDGDNQLTLQAYFEINRRDYGVGGGSLILSNTAKINVNYTLKKD